VAGVGEGRGEGESGKGKAHGVGSSCAAMVSSMLASPPERMRSMDVWLRS
jgi:hypothetical protein